jgi:hypothetical protein
MLRHVLFALAALAVGVTPGVIYHWVGLTPLWASLVICALGGFIGVALTLPMVSARRVIQTAAVSTPLLWPLAFIVGPPSEEPEPPVPPPVPPPPAAPTPVGPDPRWLTSNVVALARVIRDDGATHLLPILADALEDAGCDDPDVLRYCREHTAASSSWVVEMILGGP